MRLQIGILPTDRLGELRASEALCLSHDQRGEAPCLSLVGEQPIASRRDFAVERGVRHARTASSTASTTEGGGHAAARRSARAAARDRSARKGRAWTYQFPWTPLRRSREVEALGHGVVGVGMER
jgi:hypothetical protein